MNSSIHNGHTVVTTVPKASGKMLQQCKILNSIIVQLYFIVSTMIQQLYLESATEIYIMIKP